MSRLATRFAFPLALAALVLGGVGLARASVATLEEFARASLVPSGPPTLLGPINELGRNGWQCVPERAARAVRASDAGLPIAEEP